MTMQLGMFGGSKPFKIDKPVRLIELFAGIGSQAKALERLNLDFEHYAISEWEVNAVKSYKAVHCNENNQDYSKDFSKDQLTQKLFDLCISVDGKEPMTYEQINRKSEQWLRDTYNEFKATNNIGSIVTAKGADLKITDIDNYIYIMTYSFPCQDLSKAGKGKGMSKDGGTRSGLLWEVERLLNETEHLPQVLLMENVPDVVGTKNMPEFAKWLEFLESLGYKCYWDKLNAKDYGIPQNRDRCFMISILGDYYYSFPKPEPLELRLKDMLEDDVDEKYYLSTKLLKFFTVNTLKQQANGNGFKFEPTDGDCVAKSITTRAGGRMDDNFIKCEVVGDLNHYGNDQMNRVYGKNGVAPTIETMSGGGREPKILEPSGYYTNQSSAFERPPLLGLSRCLKAEMHDSGVVESYNNSKGYRVRKLTPKECWRLMGFDDTDFEKAQAVNSNSQLYKQAGNSIVVNVLEEIFRQMIKE